MTTQSYNSLFIAQEADALALLLRGVQESKSTHSKSLRGSEHRFGRCFCPRLRACCGWLPIEPISWT